MQSSEIFRCPACRGELSEATGENQLSCLNCASIYRIREGIPCFVPENQFYEGKFTEPRRDGASRRQGLTWALKVFYDRWSSTRVKDQFTGEFMKRFSPGTLVLDIGCGGGNEVLSPWSTVGVDLSFAGLKSAKNIYVAVAAADTTTLPFADNTFDVINSWDVFGHVPFEQKDAVLAEWKRVLKPGGWMSHIIEAHCTAPFYGLVRQDAGLFEKYFIELDGHYGLELPSQIGQRFKNAGFEVIRLWSFFRAGIFPPEEYSKRLGPEYAAQSRLLRALAALGHACERNKPLYAAVSLTTGMLARMLNPLLPLDWGSTAFIITRGQ